ncbi:MAG TPA: hypothetical protein VKG65_12505 [Terriglobales bacterium]|nr:hypothetical protein [Terriglobales bacterium]
MKWLVIGFFLLGAALLGYKTFFEAGQESANPQQPDALTPQQQRVWDALIEQASSIHNELYPVIVRHGQNDPNFARMVASTRSLMFERGKFRPVNDTDRTLEPNAYMLLVYEVNFRTRQWCLKAYGGANEGAYAQGPPLESYCQNISSP